VPGGIYFFSVNLLGRRLDTLVRYIDAWVVLLDQLHCVWTLPPGDDDFSNRWKAIRARYTQEDWEQVVRPLNDQLREYQKRALIDYLLVQKDLIDWGVVDADSLFEFFLIDAQMDACMETSRIKQAISSVQLFVQRCFLGLEDRKDKEGRPIGVAGDELDRDRWAWMQRCRV